ncbi:MAG: hypothetical protein ABI843_02730 [Dokdonella sp.]
MKILFAVSIALFAGWATAQTPTLAPAPAAMSATPPAAAAPLDLRVPVADPANSTAAGGADTPGAYYGDVSGNDVDNAAQIHGSFTTGIGYSKGYGSSTMNAAELDISKQDGDGNRFDVHINVEQSRGPGFGGYEGYYGPRYRGY